MSCRFCTDPHRHVLTDPAGQVIARTGIVLAAQDLANPHLHTGCPLDSRGTVCATDNDHIIAVHIPTGTVPIAELLDYHQADRPHPQ